MLSVLRLRILEHAPAGVVSAHIVWINLTKSHILMSEYVKDLDEVDSANMWVLVHGQASCTR